MATPFTTDDLYLHRKVMSIHGVEGHGRVIGHTDRFRAAVVMAPVGNIETQLVLYPGETHVFLGKGAPSCRLDAADRIIAWLEHFTGETQAAST